MNRDVTEQVEIEKMAKITCASCAEHNCCTLNAKFRPCDASLEYAEALYNAGYRFIDKVRKETAKEILDMLYGLGIDNEILESCRTYDVNGVSLAEQIIEKYGVEIEK